MVMTDKQQLCQQFTTFFLLSILSCKSKSSLVDNKYMLIIHKIMNYIISILTIVMKYGAYQTTTQCLFLSYPVDWSPF